MAINIFNSHFNPTLNADGVLDQSIARSEEWPSEKRLCYPITEFGSRFLILAPSMMGDPPWYLYAVVALGREKDNAQAVCAPGPPAVLPRERKNLIFT